MKARLIGAVDCPLPAGRAASGGEFADATFAAAVIGWQQQHGRHALPWQNTRDAYRVWLSEIMLQQTQVTAVIPYYQRFLIRFPDVKTLAAAPAAEVMAHWSGLGYYSRARNLHKCAQQIVREYDAKFPCDPELLASLPGIGRSTAAAIAAFSCGVRAAILDGNVKRVFARVFGIDGYPGSKTVSDLMWRRAVALLPPVGIESYTQGLMDLGATLCTRSKPACERCPLRQRCVAYAEARTDQLPQRKPAKAKPERQIVMLVVVDRDQVLLMQRPDSGIWGGLLSLPEVDDLGTADEASLPSNPVLQRALAPFGRIASCRPLPVFSHAFTHFKLYVAPYRVHLQRRADIAGQLPYVWYSAERLAQAPLPAPVKKLLLEFFRVEAGVS